MVTSSRDNLSVICYLDKREDAIEHLEAGFMVWWYSKKWKEYLTGIGGR
jgi:hypothetical protein